MMLTIALLAFLGAIATFAAVVAFYPVPIAFAAAPFGGTVAAILAAGVLVWVRSRTSARTAERPDQSA